MPLKSQISTMPEPDPAPPRPAAGWVSLPRQRLQLQLQLQPLLPRPAELLVRTVEFKHWWICIDLHHSSINWSFIHLSMHTCINYGAICSFYQKSNQDLWRKQLEEYDARSKWSLAHGGMKDHRSFNLQPENIATLMCLFSCFCSSLLFFGFTLCVLEFAWEEFQENVKKGDLEHPGRHLICQTNATFDRTSVQ